METPIDPPGNPQQDCLHIIKQEEGGEQSKSGKRERPEQSSLENIAHEKTKKNRAGKEKLEERRSLEESFTTESNGEQSEKGRQILEQEEGSQENDHAMD